jgi:hypothetical protein
VAQELTLQQLLHLPRLAWLCFSGNSVTAAAEQRALGMSQ